MKTVSKYLFFALFIGLVTTACEKEEVDHTTTLSAFSYITGNLDVALTGDNENPNAVQVTLAWEKSVAADASLVFYKVQFSDSENDFEDPFHEIIPTGLGSVPFIVLEDAQLNAIAEKGGIRQLSTGDIYWRVIATTGISSTIIGNGAKRIRITRPNGFADVPSSLYLTGIATGSNDLNAAIEMKKFKKAKAGTTNDSTVTFEIIAPLVKGEFKLVNAVKGRIRSFVFDNEGNFVEFFEGDNVKLECPANGIYHISINFQTNVFEYSQVEKVELAVIKANTADNVITTMNYTNNYTWSSDFTALLSDGSALANGSQYKFRFTEKPVFGNESKTVYWGSASASASPPADTTPESYYYVTQVESGMTNYYRFPLNVSGKQMKATLVMNPAEANFYHTCTVSE